jgi:hypothetical protein
MKGLKSTLLLLIVLVGLVGYIYYDNRQEAGDDETEKAFASLAAEDIQEVQIKSADGETSRVQKADGAWRLVEPVQAEADESELSSITSSLASLEVQRVVDENAGDLAQYGLEPARVEVSFRTKNDQQPRRVLFGERTPTGGDLYARFPDQKRVFLVSSFLDSTFNKNTFALREKSVIKFERDKVERVEIDAGDRDVTLTKSGSEWRIVAPISARADFAAVEGSLERLSSARMQGIVDPTGGDLKKYRLDPPIATVTAVAGSLRATLLFGETENALVYAKDAARPMVFSVPPTLYTDIVRDLSEYRRKDLFDSRSFTINRIEIRRGSETTTLEKSKGAEGAETWRNAAGTEIDRMKVDDLLAKITGLRAESFDPTSAAALKSPELTVNVRFDDMKMEQVTFARTGGEVVAGRADEPGTAKVESAGYEDAIKALDAMK